MVPSISSFLFYFLAHLSRGCRRKQLTFSFSSLNLFDQFKPCKFGTKHYLENVILQVCADKEPRALVKG